MDIPVCVCYDIKKNTFSIDFSTDPADNRLQLSQKCNNFEKIFSRRKAAEGGSEVEIVKKIAKTAPGSRQESMESIPTHWVDGSIRTRQAMTYWAIG